MSCLSRLALATACCSLPQQNFGTDDNGSCGPCRYWFCICCFSDAVCLRSLFFMTVGLGLFYPGLARPTNSLSLFMLCISALAIVNVQWYLFGFSLAFAESGSVFLGDTAHFVFQGVNQYAFSLQSIRSATAPKIRAGVIDANISSYSANTIPGTAGFLPPWHGG